MTHKFTQKAQKILKERYYLKEAETGELLENTPEELFRRVADFIATAENNYKDGNYKKWKGRFYEAMMNRELLPASPILFNAGTAKPMLSSCFGLQLKDTMKSILKALKDAANIFKLGGGCGFEFSKLRGSGEALSSGGSSSGPIPFMTLFNQMAEAIKQGGKRRAAILFGLDVQHPDVSDFIKMKNDNDKTWSNANISVIINDSFMKSVQRGSQKNSELWNDMMECAWKSGDPGWIFQDTIEAANTVPSKPLTCINPCIPKWVTLTHKTKGIIRLKDLNIGDKILSEDGWVAVTKIMYSGVQNVNRYVTDDGILYCTEDHKIVSNGVKVKAKDAVSIDTLSETRPSQTLPIKMIQCHSTEKVFDITVDGPSHTFWCDGFNISNCGELVGPAGFACNLAGINLDKVLKGHKGDMRIDYDKLGKLIKAGHRLLDNCIDMNMFPTEEIKQQSLSSRQQGLYFFGLSPFLIKLGLRYGSPESLEKVDTLFNYIASTSLDVMRELGKERGNFPDFKISTFKGKYKHMRAANRLCLAPSGTISRIADSYFSIEPFYLFEHDAKIMDKVIREEFDIKKEYKEIFPHALITAHDLTPKEHVDMVATISKYIDLNISKTINMPNSATIKDVSDIVMYAYKKGLKSITVYRDGCKSEQVLNKIEMPKDCRSGKCDL